MTSQGEGPVAPRPATPFATPEKPPAHVVRSVSGPFWLQRSVIARVVVALVALPALVGKLHAIPGLGVPTWVDNALLVAGAVGWFASSLLQSVDANDSAARAALQGPTVTENADLGVPVAIWTPDAPAGEK